MPPRSEDARLKRIRVVAPVPCGYGAKFLFPDSDLGIGGYSVLSTTAVSQFRRLPALTRVL